VSPLLVAREQSGGDQREFWLAKRRNPQGVWQDVPTIPGASLKGLLRSTVELLSGGDAPFSLAKEAGSMRMTEDLERAHTAVRLFGVLGDGRGGIVLAGNVSIGDAPLAAVPDGFSMDPRQWGEYQVLLSSPKPRHAAFYPKETRKLYHHQPAKVANMGAGTRTAGKGINPTQTQRLRPAPAGSVFEFTVSLRNVLSADLDTLVYALVLERDLQTPVRPDWDNPATELRIRGDMCHHLGQGKSYGFGSCRVDLVSARLRDESQLEARYRGGSGGGATTLEGAELQSWIEERTAGLRGDRSPEMEAIRRVMIFDPDDPREFRYPARGWFDANSQVPLKDA
jgi:CRISPR/Cas system CSM-associated protein Csm3 (group 7 of RAMP superfamily)